MRRGGGGVKKKGRLGIEGALLTLTRHPLLFDLHLQAAKKSAAEANAALKQAEADIKKFEAQVRLSSRLESCDDCTLHETKFCQESCLSYQFKFTP